MTIDKLFLQPTGKSQLYLPHTHHSLIFCLSIIFVHNFFLFVVFTVYLFSKIYRQWWHRAWMALWLSLITLSQARHFSVEMKKTIVYSMYDVARQLTSFETEKNLQMGWLNTIQQWRKKNCRGPICVLVQQNRYTSNCNRLSFLLHFHTTQWMGRREN